MAGIESTSPESAQHRLYRSTQSFPVCVWAQHRLCSQKIVLGFAVVQLQSFLELKNGLTQLPLLGEGNAKSVVGFGVVRIDFESFLKLGDRLVHVILLQECHAKIPASRG